MRDPENQCEARDDVRQGLTEAGAVDNLVMVGGFAGSQGASARNGTTRERVLDFVTAKPGASIQDVASGVGISHTNAAYHLSVLVRKRAVSRVTMGRLLCHYPGSQTTPQARFAYLAQDRKRVAIMRFLVEPGQVEWTINQVATGLGYYHGFLYRKLEELHQEGLVVITRMRSRQYVRATKRLHDLVAQLPKDDAAGVVLLQTPEATSIPAQNLEAPRLQP